MMNFHDYLHQRLEAGGFTTEDALAGFLPLARQVAAAHQAGLVAPLEGTAALQVEGNRIYFEEAGRQAPRSQAARIRQIDQPRAAALDIVGVVRMTTNVEDGQQSLQSLQIGKRGDDITRPVYLPGYVSWEHETGHHDLSTPEGKGYENSRVDLSRRRLLESLLATRRRGGRGLVELTWRDRHHPQVPRAAPTG